MIIKYKKQQVKGWYIAFDEKGNPIQFSKKHQPEMYQEMIDSGLPIEEFETQEEIDARLFQEKKDALLKQEETILCLIIDNQYHLTTKRKAFIPDIPIWDALLDKWDDQLDLVRDQIELMKEAKSIDDFELIEIDPVPVFE